MEPLQRLPKTSVIFDYLKKNCLAHIEDGILQRISEAAANSIFQRIEFEKSIKDLNLSIGLLQITAVGYALQNYVPNKATMTPRNQNIFEKTDFLTFSSLEKFLKNSLQLDKLDSDYRDELPMIKSRIIQQQEQGWKKYEREVEEYSKNSARASYDGPLPEYPAKPLTNFCGIISPKCPLIQVEKESFRNVEIAINTGDIIHNILKKYNLEAFYFDEFEKIIVLSSSTITPQELMIIFEKHYFETGMYPVVENERTKFGDLMIHLSDKLPSLIQPLFLPSEAEIFDYLGKDNLVKWYVSRKVLPIIAEKLDRAKFIPQETLKNLNPSFLSSEILLSPLEINLLNNALMRCAKGVPLKKLIN